MDLAALDSAEGSGPETDGVVSYHSESDEIGELSTAWNGPQGPCRFQGHVAGKEFTIGTKSREKKPRLGITEA